MAHADEPITVYGLMFGLGNPTLGQISEAFRAMPDRTLVHATGLIAVLGMAFERAFGPDDMRTKAVIGTLGPIGVTLEPRGIAPTAFSMDALFDDWRAAMAAGGPDVAAIPTHHLSRMRATIRDAVSRLGQGNDPVQVGLGQALATVDALLRDRGVLSDEVPAGGFQA